mgnify:CR=1 FL=1|jgi:pseudouridine synthase
MKIVLQKLIASAGVCSRHQAEKYIASGRVKLNGKTAKLGDRADENDAVLVDKKPLRFTKTHTYIKLYKPAGVVSTTRSFPSERNVLDFVKLHKPLAIVGRLDKESEGLVILTDDGDLAYKLTHPKFKVTKVYVVTLTHDLGANREEIKQKVKEVSESFARGVEIGLGDGRVKVERFKHLRGRTFEIVLAEGKKRQIRRMFRAVGCHVGMLKRVRIANVTVAGVSRGRWKYLSKEEIHKLKAL